MSFITTNPNPFIINVPELQNVQTNASGLDAAALNNVLSAFDVLNNAVNVNTIRAFDTNLPIAIASDLNLLNTSITFLGSNLLSSNAVNGPAGVLAMQVADVEYARLTPTGFGVNIDDPITSLDIGGSALVRGALYISTMGASPLSTLGNVYADGDIFATGIKYPSDPILKQNIRTYDVRPRLPTPVEFVWRSNQIRDIGVLADEIESIEPACVQRRSDGTLAVDYPKLTVLLLAEIHALKKQMNEWMAAHS